MNVCVGFFGLFPERRSGFGRKWRQAEGGTERLLFAADISHPVLSHWLPGSGHSHPVRSIMLREPSGAAQRLRHCGKNTTTSTSNSSVCSFIKGCGAFTLLINNTQHTCDSSLSEGTTMCMMQNNRWILNVLVSTLLCSSIKILHTRGLMLICNNNN